MHTDLDSAPEVPAGSLQQKLRPNFDRVAYAPLSTYVLMKTAAGRGPPASRCLPGHRRERGRPLIPDRFQGFDVLVSEEADGFER